MFALNPTRGVWTGLGGSPFGPDPGLPEAVPANWTMPPGRVPPAVPGERSRTLSLGCVWLPGTPTALLERSAKRMTMMQEREASLSPLGPIH